MSMFFPSKRVVAVNGTQIKFALFDGLKGEEYGGAIESVDVEPLSLYQAKFVNCEARVEGGAIHLLRARAAFQCIQFEGCKVSFTEDNVGGNAIGSYESWLEMRFSSQVRCAPSTSSGNSLWLSKKGKWKVWQANVSSNKAGGSGDLLMFWLGSEISEIWYANVVNQKDCCSLVLSRNVRTDIAKTNFVNSGGDYFLLADGAKSYCNESCFFDVIGTSSYTILNGRGNWNMSGVSVVNSTILVNLNEVGDECYVSHVFSNDMCLKNLIKMSAIVVVCG